MSIPAAQEIWADDSRIPIWGAETRQVTVASGQNITVNEGEIVLLATDATGNYIAFTNAALTTTESLPSAILTTSVDASAGATAATVVVIGSYNQNAVAFPAGITLDTICTVNGLSVYDNLRSFDLIARDGISGQVSGAVIGE